MKKKIIYSSVLTALLASSMALAGGPDIIPEPDYFSGLYIGGIGGVHHTTFNGNSQVVLTQPIAVFFNLIPIVPLGVVNSTNVGGGDYAGFGGLQGGFGKVLNHQFYVGLQGYGSWGNTSETSTESRLIPFNTLTPIPGVTITPAASASSSTNMKLNDDYGFAGKFGWVVAPRSMIYGKVGASWARIQVSNTVAANASLVVNSIVGQLFNIATTAGATSSQTDTKLGLLLGVGFEQFVYQDVVSINVEADYTNYGHVNTTPSQVFRSTSLVIPPLGFAGNFGPTATNFYNSASVSARVTSLMAGLNFYFGRNWF